MIPRKVTFLDGLTGIQRRRRPRRYEVLLLLTTRILPSLGKARKDDLSMVTLIDGDAITLFDGRERPRGKPLATEDRW
jgi:hypothetical protein